MRISLPVRYFPKERFSPIVPPPFPYLATLCHTYVPSDPACYTSPFYPTSVQWSLAANANPSSHSNACSFLYLYSACIASRHADGPSVVPRGARPGLCMVVPEKWLSWDWRRGM